MKRHKVSRQLCTSVILLRVRLRSQPLLIPRSQRFAHLSGFLEGVTRPRQPEYFDIVRHRPLPQHLIAVTRNPAAGPSTNHGITKKSPANLRGVGPPQALVKTELRNVGCWRDSDEQ